IANGIQSGQLTAGETANLEKKEAALNQEIRTDRQQNGGNLTNKQKAQINRQQNRLSKQIYQDKHNNTSAQYGNNEIGARRQIQQDRIANGVRSGRLSAGETANLETKESAINKEIAADRQANGGNLTNKQKRQVNRQQNRVSRQIARDKAN